MSGYEPFLDSAVRIGYWLFSLSFGGMLLSFGFLAFLLFRHGKTGTDEGGTEPFRAGAGKTKVFYDRSTEISERVIASGTATPLQRLEVAWINFALICMFMLFVGITLLMVKDTPLIAVLLIPVTYYFVTMSSHIFGLYRKGKKRIAARAKKSDASRSAPK